MRALVRLRGDGPDAAAVAGAAFVLGVHTLAALTEASPLNGLGSHRAEIGAVASGRAHWVVAGRLFDRLVVKEIPLRLRQQEHVLMRLGAAVAHAFWHRVWLVPNDVLA